MLKPVMSSWVRQTFLTDIRTLGLGDLIREVVTQCNTADVRHRVMPPTDALLEQKVALSNLREVSLQDLLGRPPVRLSTDRIQGMISGQTVLITGAGGEVGHGRTLAVDHQSFTVATGSTHRRLGVSAPLKSSSNRCSVRDVRAHDTHRYD